MQKLNNQTSMGNITKNVTYQAFIAGKVPKELAKSAAEETARNSRDFSDLKKSVAGLDESVTELRQEIKDSEAETRRELKEFLHKEIAVLESVLAAKIAEIHRDILKEILENRAVMAGLETKMAELETKMAEMKLKIISTVVGASGIILTGMAVAIAISRFVLFPL